MTKKKSSAGILIYQIGQNPFHTNVEGEKRREDLYLLGHYGGPFFEKKDLGTWTIPKGEIEDNENILDADIRELQEETEIQIQQKENMIALNSIKQKSGKIIHAWAYEDKKNNDLPARSTGKRGRLPHGQCAGYVAGYDTRAGGKRVRSRWLGRNLSGGPNLCSQSCRGSPCRIN